MLAFTSEVYVSLLVQYNAAIWPAQPIAAVLGVLAAMLARRGSRLGAAILAALWLWTGVAWHYLSFATINFAAPAFALLFVVQGLLLLRAGEFRFLRDRRGWAGLAVMAFAMAGYPLLTLAVGRSWPEAAAFGVAPGPTVIFTLGLLLWARPRAPWRLLVIPLLWCAIGAAYAWLLGISEDLALLPAALVALALRGADRRANHRGTENTDVHREE